MWDRSAGRFRACGLLLVLVLVLVTAASTASTASAAEWAAHGPRGASVTAIAIDGADPATLYLGTATGSVHRSTDGGEIWTRSSDGLPGVRIEVLAADPVTTGVVYAGTLLGGAFKTSDAGETWSAIGEGLPSSFGIVTSIVIHPTSPSTLLAAVDGEVFRSIDGGASWTPSGDGLELVSIRVLAFDPADPDTLFAGPEIFEGQQNVHRSTDGGASWEITPAALRVFRGFAFPDPGSGRVCTGGESPGGGRVLVSLDDGESWDLATLPAGAAPVHALASPPGAPGTAYAATLGGGLLRSTDGCETWTPVATTGGLPAALQTVAIDPSSADVLYAGGLSSLFASTNGGTSWSERSDGLVDSRVDAVRAHPTIDGTAYAGLVDGGGVAKATDAGLSWALVNTGLGSGSATVRAIAIAPGSPGTVWAGGRGGGSSWVWKTTDGGTSWSPTSSGFDAATLDVRTLAIHPKNAAIVYAGGSGLTPVHRTTNGGISWTPASTGLPAPQGSPIRTVLALAIDPSAPATVYAATGSDRVHKTTDAGASWSAAHAGLPIGSTRDLVIDPDSPATLYVAMLGDGVFKTVDGGASWTPASDGLGSLRTVALAIDPSFPEVLYVGTDDAGVFRSLDGGVTWSAFDEGLTKLHMTALSIDPTAPRRVYASTDGGGVFVRTETCGDGALDPGEACDDGNPIDGDCCTSTCTLPAPICAAALPGEGRLELYDRPGDGDVLKWRWVTSAAVALDDFGDPAAATDLSLCVLDAPGGVPTLRASARAEGGSTCGSKPCWKAGSRSVEYSDPKRTGSDGLVKIVLKGGDVGAAAIRISGKGMKLGLPALPLAPPVTARLVRGDGAGCWEATSSEPRRNDVLGLRAEPD